MTRLRNENSLRTRAPRDRISSLSLSRFCSIRVFVTPVLSHSHTHAHSRCLQLIFVQWSRIPCSDLALRRRHPATPPPRSSPRKHLHVSSRANFGNSARWNVVSLIARLAMQTNLANLDSQFCSLYLFPFALISVITSIAFKNVLHLLLWNYFFRKDIKFRETIQNSDSCCPRSNSYLSASSAPLVFTSDTIPRRFKGRRKVVGNCVVCGSMYAGNTRPISQ